MVSKIGIAVCLPLIALAGSASAGQSELEKLFIQNPASPAANICMVRHYSKAHLFKHPYQNVTDMLIYIAKAEGLQDGWIIYNVSLQIKFRDSKKDWSSYAGCMRETGQAVTSVYCGVDCDGGGFHVNLRSDKSVELTTSSGVRLGEPGSEEEIDTAGFKSDDQSFVLQQTALEDCVSLVYDEDLKAQIAKGAVTQ